jgi:type IV secretion system protein VirB11
MSLLTSTNDRSTTCRSMLEQAGITGLLNQKGITELTINRPYEILTESLDGWVRHEIPNLSFDFLGKLINALAVLNGQSSTIKNPILSVVLPDGERAQLVSPPACPRNTVSITIRKPSPTRFSIDEYFNSGRLSDFEDVSYYKDVSIDMLQAFEKDLLQTKNNKDMKSFLQAAIDHQLNIVLVGATGSGKTTATKALVDLVPKDTRIVTIEDTPELDLPNHPNHVHLYFGKDISAKQVVSSCMRMKPDRIFLTELRGDETWDYISLLNTGHPGSVTTVHANDCRSAFSRIGTLIKQSDVGQTLDMSFIMREVYATIDLVLFFKRTYLTQLYYDPVYKYKMIRGELS